MIKSESRKLYSKLFQLLNKIHSDSLYRNSLYLIASQFALAGLGFFFWIINARLFSPAQVGIATTLISITNLITNFSMMGFNIASIRYFPEEKDKNAYTNTAYFIVSLASIILIIIFLIGLPLFSPPLLPVLRNYMVATFFAVFMIIATLNAITDSIFIALRNTKYILIIDIAVGLVKVASPFLLVSVGYFGVFYAYVVAVSVGMILSFAFLWRFGLHVSFALKKDVIQRVWKFAGGNYLAGLIGMFNGTILPILITNSLGSNITAFFYMPTMIASLVQSFPRSMSSSMFAEGAKNNMNLKKLFLKSLKGTYIIMIPITAVLFLLGPYILLAFGKSYSQEGIVYLRYSLISLLITVPNYLFGSVLSIKKKVGLTIFMSIAGAVIGLTLIITLLKFGLTGLGIANISTQLIMFVVYFIVTVPSFEEKGLKNKKSWKKIYKYLLYFIKFESFDREI